MRTTAPSTAALAFWRLVQACDGVPAPTASTNTAALAQRFPGVAEQEGACRARDLMFLPVAAQRPPLIPRSFVAGGK